jgi:pimeloyl-ACP methyl ester carboxylesterase
VPGVEELGGLPAMTLGPGAGAAPGAPPLVILPGLAPEHAVPSGPLRWAEVSLMRPFARRRRVIWLARRPGLAPGTSIADVAADLADVLRSELGASARPVDLLGISTGGSIALQLAADHPETVRRLVLVSSAARLGDGARALQRRIAAYARAGRTRAALALLVADVAPPRTLRAGALRAAGWALGPLAYPEAGDLSDLATLIEAEDAFDLSHRLREIAAPTLIVAGGRDRAYDPEDVERTARGIPGARLVRYARRGHVTAAADPRFVPAVERFLDAPMHRRAGRASESVE